jgi:hypothetical protein
MRAELRQGRCLVGNLASLLGGTMGLGAVAWAGRSGQNAEGGVSDLGGVPHAERRAEPQQIPNGESAGEGGPASGPGAFTLTIC